jgi:hypothetical protein
MNVTWDYKDDYYIVEINDIEINIRTYKSTILVWLYDHTKEIEILDEEYNSLEDIKIKLRGIFDFDIKLPNIIELQRIEAR